MNALHNRADWRAWTRCALGALLVCVMISGCSESETSRFPIRGTVTLDGKPVTNATIIFTPKAEGLASAAVIEDGQFSILAQHGPTAGEFRVRINPVEPEVEESAASPARASRLHKIPIGYQREGKLSVTVHGQPDQSLDIKLSSRP